MKKFYGLVVFMLLLAPALFAQEHYTEGPIWRIQLIRVKPTHMDEYLTTLRQSTKPLIEEEKKQALIMDYKVFFKRPRTTRKIGTSAWPSNTRTSPPWMACAKGEGVRDKIWGARTSGPAAQ